MAMQKRNLNAVYISERLRESLRPISHCALTTVVAPMGYGKTTAVNWYLSQRASEAARIIRVSVYSDNLAIFWQSVQSAFCHGGLSFLSGYPCPADAAGGSLLADELCHRLAGETEFFIFLDDFHLLTDGRIPGFLCTLAGRLPENVHIIAASRDRFLPRDAVLRLGRRACSIGIQQLRLNHTELAVYTRRCGIRLTDRQVDDLLYTTEGWFSAVYLNLCSLADRGQLPSHASDIYDMFTAAMLDPSVFVCMGKPVPNYMAGDPSRKMMPLGIVMDERICTGYEYAAFCHDFRRNVCDPQVLTRSFNAPAEG